MASCRLTPEQIAKGLEIFQKSPEQFDDWFRAATKPGFSDKFFEYRRAAMLSGPSSIAKAAGDVTGQVLDILRAPAEIGLSQIRGKLTGTVPTNSWSEIGAHMQGLHDAIGPMNTILQRMVAAGGRVLSGSEEGLAGALEAARRTNPGVPDNVLMKQLLSDKGSLSEMSAGAIGGRAGTIIRTPFRAFEEISNFFRGMSGQVEMNKQALREAISNARDAGVSDAGMKDWVGKRYGDIRTQLMDALKNGNEDVFPEMQKAIAKAQDYMTFNQELGPVGRYMNAARNAPGPGGFAAKMILPFFKVPMNIAKVTVEHTPLDAYRLWSHWGEFEKAGTLSEEMSKSVIGTTIGMSAALAAANGLLTGAGPNDPKARAMLEKSGWQPYSMKLPDGSYLSYHRGEPLAGLMGMAADMYEATNEKDLNAAATHMVGSIGQNLINKTFLKGLSDFAGALHEPLGASAQRFFQNMETSVVPSIVQHAASAIDPSVPDANLATAIPSVIPGLKSLVPPKVDSFGDVQTRGEGETAAERLLSPFSRSEEKPGADLEREMARISYEPPKLESTLRLPVKGEQTKIPLTPEEQQTFQEARQKAVERARALVASPGWDKLPDTPGDGITRANTKVGRLEQIFEAYDKQARASITRGPDFRARAREAMQTEREKRSA